MKHILIIEDELIEPYEDNMFVLYLAKAGYKLDYASTGDEACDKLYSNIYDFVYFDIMLPPSKEDSPKTIWLKDVPRPDVGHLILKKLREGEFEPNGIDRDIPVLVVSAVTGDTRWASIKKLIKNGDYLTKPCSPETTFDKINTIINSMSTDND